MQKRRNQMRRKSRRQRQRGGALALDPQSVVIWRNVQDEEESAPIVSSYRELRDELELD
jgi:hypothetical protein